MTEAVFNFIMASRSGNRFFIERSAPFNFSPPEMSCLMDAEYETAQHGVGLVTVAHGQHPSSILESRKILFVLEPGWQFLKHKAQRRLVAFRCVSFLLQLACF